MASVIIEIILSLVQALVDSGVFARVEAAVVRWDDKQISGLEKKQGVLAELGIIGLELNESVANLLIELAVTKMKQNAGGSAKAA